MAAAQSSESFPGRLPARKPEGRPLSTAMARFYDQWGATQDPANPFYTTFRYSRLAGSGATTAARYRDATPPRC